MKIKIKQLFDEITRQKVYPLTTLKAVRDPKSKKALDEMLLVGEDEESAEEVAQRDADILGGKYKATDIDRAVTFDSEETEEVEDVSITDADRLGGKYTATDVDALKQRIVELETENEKLNNSLSDLNSNLATQVTTVEASVSYTISANGTWNTNTTIPEITSEIPKGYTPVGIVGFTTNNTNVIPINMNYSGNAYAITLKNTSNSSVTASLLLKILCIKTY